MQKYFKLLTVLLSLASSQFFTCHAVKVDETTLNPFTKVSIFKGDNGILLPPVIKGPLLNSSNQYYFQMDFKVFGTGGGTAATKLQVVNYSYASGGQELKLVSTDSTKTLYYIFATDCNDFTNTKIVPDASLGQTTTLLTGQTPPVASETVTWPIYAMLGTDFSIPSTMIPLSTSDVSFFNKRYQKPIGGTSLIFKCDS